VYFEFVYAWYFLKMPIKEVGIDNLKPFILCAAAISIIS
jgi:hypothetical protein